MGKEESRQQPVLGHLAAQVQQDELDPHLTPYTKPDSKGIRDQNAAVKTM